MDGIFYDAFRFNRYLNWNTGKVRDMGFAFSGAKAFDLNLPWNTQNVLYMVSSTLSF